MKITIDTVTDSKKDIEHAANFLMQLVSGNDFKEQQVDNSVFDMPKDSGMGFFDDIEKTTILKSENNLEANLNEDSDKEVISEVQFY